LKHLAIRAKTVAWCCAITALSAAFSGPAGAFSVQSWYEERWNGVHRQETDESCGPASVVTLLRGYFDIDVSEPEVFALATDYLTDFEKQIARALQGGTSLRGLRDALNALGFRSVGVRITYDDLLRYFADAGLPVIAHFDLPEQHFVVITGKVGTDSILVADPSQGWYVLRRSGASARFSGNVLLYEPTHAVREDVVERQVRKAEQLQRFALRLGSIPGRPGV